MIEKDIYGFNEKELNILGHIMGGVKEFNTKDLLLFMKMGRMQRLGGIVNPSSPTTCMDIADKGRNISILTHR